MAILPQKILLVQLYSNGDCLYATAVARQIKADFPGCFLTWAIASFCKSIIAHNPYVDAVMEVGDAPKNDVAAFRRFRRKVFRQKKQGLFDEVFITHNMDRNHAYYDGCIRSSILRAYRSPITVPVIPVLKLTDLEVQHAADFQVRNHLSEYEHVVLFEFAPQSGQSPITRVEAIRLAEEITKNGRTAVILSSANRIEHSDKAIIDGSSLTLRETAALTHYCDLLLGTSSGITWISTSDAAKNLPMVQLLNPYTTWVNPISRDFARFGFSTDTVIELLSFDSSATAKCVSLALADFHTARATFNQRMPLHFKTTRSIVYNLLCYCEFGSIIKHIQVNRQVYGNNLQFYKELMVGIVEFPFRLINNLISKKIVGKKRGPQ